MNAKLRLVFWADSEVFFFFNDWRAVFGNFIFLFSNCLVGLRISSRLCLLTHPRHSLCDRVSQQRHKVPVPQAHRCTEENTWFAELPFIQL